MKNDVIPAFNEFDENKNGTINKQELQSLMKKLGQEIDEQQTELALKDLDLNKDGVIDLDEFKRWYFTGMKPYNGARRTLLKVGAKSKKLIDTIAVEAKAALLEQELKFKKNKISLGFNAPENPQTTLKLNYKLGGADSLKLANELFGKYKDTANKKKETRRFVEGWRSENDDVFYAEVKFNVNQGTATKHAENIQKLINEMVALIPDDEDELYFHPKV